MLNSLYSFGIKREKTDQRWLKLQIPSLSLRNLEVVASGGDYVAQVNQCLEENSESHICELPGNQSHASKELCQYVSV